VLALAVAFAALTLAALPRSYAPGPAEIPAGAARAGASTRIGRGGSGIAAKSTAIRRGAYSSLAGVRGILALGADPSALIREQAALALGVNLVVSDIEHAGPEHASRYASLALRDSLRDGLMVLLRDSVEAVRAEAARALWKAPRTFGTVPAAAETLAAVLDRAGRPGVPERLAWLALDAAAGAAHPGLRGAAARFAASTPDSALGRAARLAAGVTRPARGRP
jgi:hypothetical protein